MNNKRWLLDHGYIPSDTLSELIDLVMQEQRQMCHDKIIEHIKDFPTDSDLGPWYECADMCLNATGDKSEPDLQYCLL